jgi:hypothetical protein
MWDELDGDGEGHAKQLYGEECIESLVAFDM